MIIPVFKSGERSQTSNYRPISLLPIVSKVFEKLIYLKVIELVFDNISPNQFGFLTGRSTLQQLLIQQDLIVNALENQNAIDYVYLDFRKAFDTIPHNELLLKLWNIGIVGDLWEWFKTYLITRRQCVSIDNAQSSFLPVISGVPQGSVLGPLLYINDLPNSIFLCLLTILNVYVTLR